MSAGNRRCSWIAAFYIFNTHSVDFKKGVQASKPENMEASGCSCKGLSMLWKSLVYCRHSVEKALF